MDAIPATLAVLVLLAIFLSCFVSASAGLGGSLILVPTLALVMGTKEGVALAALLLAVNNMVKVAAYRNVLPIRKALPIVVTISIGAFVGASLLVAAPENAVTFAVITAFVVALVAERRELRLRSRVLAPVLSLASGATSGFSGTSGPLKGLAVKSLALDRLHTVGAAALVSLFGDVTKVIVFAEGGLLDRSLLQIVLLAAPLMLVATFSGRLFNQVIGERGYTRLFWLVMGGYAVRLVSSALP